MLHLEVLVILVWVYLSYEGYPEIKDTKRVGRGREITAVKVLDHPAHSPDLAHSHFHLFLHLKHLLAGQKFQEDEMVKNGVTM